MPVSTMPKEIQEQLKEVWGAINRLDSKILKHIYGENIPLDSLSYPLRRVVQFRLTRIEY